MCNILTCDYIIIVDSRLISHDAVNKKATVLIETQSKVLERFLFIKKQRAIGKMYKRFFCFRSSISRSYLYVDLPNISVEEK